jgi:prolyl-tRNA synthetase
VAATALTPGRSASSCATKPHTAETLCDAVTQIEEDVKKRSTTPEAAGAKTLCIPFDQPPLPEGALCFASGKPAKNWALWGRSY